MPIATTRLNLALLFGAIGRCIRCQSMFHITELDEDDKKPYAGKRQVRFGEGNRFVPRDAGLSASSA